MFWRKYQLWYIQRKELHTKNLNIILFMHLGFFNPTFFCVLKSGKLNENSMPISLLIQRLNNPNRTPPHLPKKKITLMILEFDNLKLIVTLKFKHLITENKILLSQVKTMFVDCLWHWTCKIRWENLIGKNTLYFCLKQWCIAVVYVKVDLF